MAVAMAVAEGDMAAAAVGVMVVMEAEAASTILHHIRADTILLAAAMMVAIVLGVVDRREAVAEAEVSEALASDLDVYSPAFFYPFLHILLVLCFV